MKISRRQIVRLFLALVSCAALRASARLDESEAESAQRYGAPMKTLEDPLHYTPLFDGAICHTYQFQGWTIRVAFINDRAVRITYSKIITKDVKPAIQDDELQAILAGEAGGGQWRKVAPSSGGGFQQAMLAAVLQSKEFVNTNGNHAQMDNPFYNLTLETPMAKAFIQARAAAKERQRQNTIPKF
jgi:hypothetical protein